MPDRTVTICNELGLHARAAAKLVECASRFSCGVQVSCRDRTVNGKSIMGVLMLAAAQGVEIGLATDGEDEDEALNALVTLVEDGFGELTP